MRGEEIRHISNSHMGRTMASNSPRRVSKGNTGDRGRSLGQASQSMREKNEKHEVGEI